MKVILDVLRWHMVCPKSQISEENITVASVWHSFIAITTFSCDSQLLVV
jgi:hypothetical protein